MNDPRDSDYQQRFYKVLQYIDEHLDEDLNLEQLSQQAHCSKFHFHRQFSAFLGITSAHYIFLKRMKRSAYQLAFRKQIKIIEVAILASFENPESFSRAFKRITALSPSKYRQTPEWSCWQPPSLKIKTGNIAMSQGDLDLIKIVDFPLTKLAVLEHCGDPAELYKSIQTFIAWRKINGPSPKQSRTFNILYDDPETTAKHLYRFDIAASLTGELATNDYPIVEKTIPPGRCAVLTMVGSDDKLAEKINWMFTLWLAQSGEELRDFPVFIERLKVFPDVAEHETLTAIYLPLK